MTEEDRLALIESHRKGWEQEPYLSIFVTHNPASGNFVLRDWSGYLCKTNNPSLLLELIQMESLLKGSVRHLLSGKSLNDLAQLYQEKQRRISESGLKTQSQGKCTASPFLTDLDVSDLL